MLTISNLRIEYQKNPLGMDDRAPRFSYELTGGSARQIACRICVVSETGDEVWDSGFVASGETIQISYKGVAFKPFTRYDWKVQVKDENGGESNDTPVRMSDIYMGETYEAWREDEDRDWASKLLPYKNVYAEKCDSVGAKLVWHSGAAIRRMAEFKPVSIVKRPSGSYLVDFGQNFAGRERIRLENTRKGSVIPAAEDSVITEGGQPAEKAMGVKFLRQEPGAAVYEVQSGCYEFDSSQISTALPSRSDVARTPESTGRDGKPARQNP